MSERSAEQSARIMAKRQRATMRLWGATVACSASGWGVRLGKGCRFCGRTLFRRTPGSRLEIVLKGVSSGEGSAIAAGRVVADSLPAHILAGGCPAKVIRAL